jgi:predicted RNA polymerase sigma factor
VSWYDVLLTVTDTSVVRLNRAVAVGELRGASAGLDEVDRITDLPAYLPFVAVRAEFLARAGRVEEAKAAFSHALKLPGNAAAKRSLSRRMAGLLAGEPKLDVHGGGQ